MSSSPLLRLDLTSEDTLYSTDSIHNQVCKNAHIFFLKKIRVVTLI